VSASESRGNPTVAHFLVRACGHATQAHPRRTRWLTFIEVQRGDYFGEDDIVRLEDDFGRAGPKP